jgi:polyphosphate kinase 2 (PPK2 family)
VFKNFNVRGVNVHSFKTPTSTELEHDYLWRHYIALPEKGKFAVFNRSHYENVLVSRVHPEYVLKENLPGITAVDDITDDFWEQRYEQINNFEKHIAQRKGCCGGLKRKSTTGSSHRQTWKSVSCGTNTRCIMRRR